MAITSSTVFGTKPDVTTALGEDTLTIAYPTSIAAGDILAMAVIGTIAGSTSPSAGGLWTGATWNTVTTGKVNFYWPPVVAAAGGESGNITITKGGTLSRLIGAIIVKFDAFTYLTHANFANNVTTNHNGAALSGGTPLTVTLDDGTIFATVPDVTKDRFTYSVWYFENAGNSGHPMSETFAGPSSESLIVSAQKDEEANPSNANTRDRFIRASGLQAWPAGTALASVTETETDTSGLANPNQALLSDVSLRFAFTSTPPAAGADYWAWASA